ncbi:uncharacterized protein N7482_000506 [Penicillium canariense]|uniref:Zn(2)-C6 fungal-type domain-containing protein n=1 Tax=Penicillium canariense TaxID=189055 RepID=A0A9W9IEA8_9EURO|nr:uncharacterized protein N7482_000506 [Penicillium canariense]KAJ5174629.1 hypothetical protein N7482_000506 [Penicillium canariense]
MVGVPNSKGCLLCRERRIRCDQSLPHCMQCRRYGALCPGYKRPWQFQDEGPRLQKRYQKKFPVVRRSDVEPDPEAAHNNASVRKQVLTTVSIDERVYPSLVHQSFISQQPRVFKDFICASFPTMFFHNEFRFGDGFTFPDWVLKHFGSKPYYDASVSCLSAEYLAHLTKDPRLHQFSRQKYSQALGGIRQALGSDEASSDALLIAVILLSFYEMTIRTTRDGWVYHSRAVKHLMLKRGMDLHRAGAGRVCHFAYRPFLIAAALHEGEPCFLGEDIWQDLAAILRVEDSQKQSEWSFYINVYEAIFMELVKCPGYIQEAREIASVTSPKAVILAKRIHIACGRLQMLNSKLRSLLVSDNQRKLGIIFHHFIGPAPNAFPETSPSLLLNASVNALGILVQLLNRLTLPAYVEEEPPCSSYGTLSPSSTRQSVSTPPNGSGPFLDFRLVCELGEGIDKGDPRAFTWLDRVAGSMGLLGAKAIYEGAV